MLIFLACTSQVSMHFSRCVSYSFCLPLIIRQLTATINKRVKRFPIANSHSESTYCAFTLLVHPNKKIILGGHFAPWKWYARISSETFRTKCAWYKWINNMANTKHSLSLHMNGCTDTCILQQAHLQVWQLCPQEISRIQWSGLQKRETYAVIMCEILNKQKNFSTSGYSVTWHQKTKLVYNTSVFTIAGVSSLHNRWIGTALCL